MKGPESAVIEIDEIPHYIRGMAVGSFAMSFLGLCTWWLIPFGALLSLAAILFASLSILLGVRTVGKGIYYPVGAIMLSSINIGSALISTKLAGFLFLGM